MKNDIEKLIKLLEEAQRGLEAYVEIKKILYSWKMPVQEMYAYIQKELASNQKDLKMIQKLTLKKEELNEKTEEFRIIINENEKKEKRLAMLRGDLY